MGLILTGCRNSAKTATVDDSTQLKVKFDFFFRESQQVPHSVEKSIEFEVSVVQGPVAEIELLGISKPISVTVGSFEATVTKSNNSFYLDIFERSDTAFRNDQKQRLVLRQLFQIDNSIAKKSKTRNSKTVNFMANQFAGGHGFTGLVYVNHSRSDAELQFYGQAVDQ